MEPKPNYKLMALAIGLALIIFIVWDSVFLDPMRQEQAQVDKAQSSTTHSLLPVNGYNKDTYFANSSDEKKELKSAARVNISNANVVGSINLRGAKIDSLILSCYKDSLAKDSQNIVLFHPEGTPHAYYFASGLLGSSDQVDVPSDTTLWHANSTKLTPSHSVILTYTNKQGVEFKKIISIDEQYMLQITDEIVNHTKEGLEVYPWSFIAQHGEPAVNDTFISHEGVVGFVSSSLEYETYKNMKKHETITYRGENRFLGFADKYFMASILPQGDPTANLRYFTTGVNHEPNYQADYLGQATLVKAGGSYANVTHLFVGPKAYDILHNYGKQFKIKKFEDSIDFGWFFFITKPFLKVLLFFYHHLHHFGYAMLCFTIFIRLLIFPISYISFSSMARMRELQPQLKELKEKCAGDNQRYNKEIMALYRKERVNPLAGCLPLLVQIPILFSIYKVIYISIEMRHATFWWIKDLSAPDTANIFNLFGLLPYDVPGFLNIGIWAILMGVTMYIQQRLTASAGTMNETQKKMMTWLPVIMVFILASFPVGLLIYWCWSNIISIGQQIVINRFVHNHPHRHTKTS